VVVPGEVKRENKEGNESDAHTHLPPSRQGLVKVRAFLIFVKRCVQFREACREDIAFLLYAAELKRSAVYVFDGVVVSASSFGLLALGSVDGTRRVQVYWTVVIYITVRRTRSTR
jgi:hypothetical protein